MLRPNPTGPDGQTTLRVRCSDPGNPRDFVDGQMYQLDLGINGVDQASLRQNPLEPITGLVFDDYRGPDNPTWFDDVLPIFKQYANLYPIMSERLVRLDDYEEVRRHREILQFAFSRDLGDPNSMPVTRDLSAAKRRMILKWLALPDLPLGVEPPRPAPTPATPPRTHRRDRLQGPLRPRLPPCHRRERAVIQIEKSYLEAVRAASTPRDLHESLQSAIVLELATIPPYLTAYFSLKPGENTEVADLVRSVVIEEMLHLTIAANVLNASAAARRSTAARRSSTTPPLPMGSGASPSTSDPWR